MCRKARQADGLAGQPGQPWDLSSSMVVLLLLPPSTLLDL